MGRFNIPFYRTTPVAAQSEQTKTETGAGLDPEQNDGNPHDEHAGRAGC
jgi:hypothetical protein